MLPRRSRTPTTHDPARPLKLLIQRVSRSQVSVSGEVVGSIGHGYTVLVGVREGDTETDAVQLATRTVNLRVFADDDGRMNLDLLAVGGEVLAISQFTLYADTRKGNRPGFARAGDPAEAERLYEAYVRELRARLGPDRVATGAFGAAMSVEITNDGPVTIELTSD